MQKFEIKNLVNTSNNEAVQTALFISKQDAAIKTAINTLNALKHVTRLEFTDPMGVNYGLNNELIEKVNELQEALQKAHHGRF